MHADENESNGRGGESIWNKGATVWEDYKMKRGMVFGAIIVGALLAFEVFNYTTTDFALSDLLGDVRFVGLRWAMILALAFCGMDFAGLARLFTPERGRGEKVEVWYMLAAWFLAATMNAILTWWGVSLALLNHDSLGNEILSRETLLSVVPVFVALLVWIIRILMIGTLSMEGPRLFTQADEWPSRTDRQSAYREGAERIVEPMRARPSTYPVPAAAPKAVARPAHMIGVDADDDFDQRRRPGPEPVNAFRRAPAGANASPPQPTAASALPVVRPAPKPPTSGNPSHPPAGTTGLRPALSRTSEPAGNNGLERH